MNPNILHPFQNLDPSALLSDFLAENTIYNYALSVIILLVCILVSTGGRRYIVRFFESTSSHEKGGTIAGALLRALNAVPIFSYIIVSVYFPLKVLVLPAPVHHALNIIISIFLAFLVT